MGNAWPSAAPRALRVGVAWVGFCNRRLDLCVMDSVIKKRFPMTLLVAMSVSSLLAADKFAERLGRLDRNNDGKLSREEAPKSFRKFKFDHADRNKDGFLDKREMDWSPKSWR